MSHYTLQKGSVFICFFLLNLLTEKTFSSYDANETLKRQHGQSFMLGVSGKTLTVREQKVISKIKPGGIILFKRNIQDKSQVRELIRQIKTSIGRDSPEPLVAVDQEGGRVARLKISPPMVSPLALAQAKDPNIIERYSFLVGCYLQNFGFNMNLAPVLDVSNADQPSFIGERSFGNDPGEVSRIGRSFSQGQISAGIMPTGKHFPGAGGTTTDVHFQSARDLASLNDLKDLNLKAFDSFLTLAPSALMMSHLEFSKIDPVPSTYSKKIISDLLRDGLKFDGLVLTDDLMMKGARQDLSVSEAAAKSLVAGNDMVMISWSPKTQLETFTSTLESFSNSSPDAIESRYNRISKIKDTLSSLRVAARERCPKVPDLKKELSSIEGSILEKNLKREIQNLAHLEISENTISVASHYTGFQNFKSAFEQNCNWIDSATSGLSSRIRSVLKSNPKNWLVLLLNKKQQVAELKSLPMELRGRVLVISTISRGNIIQSEVGALIQLDHYHPKTMRMFGQYLRRHLKAATSSKSQARL